MTTLLIKDRFSILHAVQLSASIPELFQFIFRDAVVCLVMAEVIERLLRHPFIVEANAFKFHGGYLVAMTAMLSTSNTSIASREAGLTSENFSFAPLDRAPNSVLSSVMSHPLLAEFFATEVSVTEVV